MQTKKHEKEERGQAEKNPIVSDEGTLVSRPILLMHTQLCIFARYALLLMTLCVLVVAFPTPTVALASNPLGPKGASVSLDFEQAYKLDKKIYVHRGIDLPAAAGSPIGAPCSGIVSFVGDVPAGDSSVVGMQQPKSGKTMRAVSIQLDDGKVVTLMPLSKSVVSVGQAVEEGESLGILAATGDRSSPKTHLHMGLKKGGVYFDPKRLLGITAEADVVDNKAGHQAVSKKAGRALSAQGEGVAPIGAIKATEAKHALSEQRRLGKEDAVNIEDPMGNIKTISSDVPISSIVPTKASSKGRLSEICDRAAEAMSGFAAACAWQVCELNASISDFAKESGIPLLFLYLLLTAAMIVISAFLLFVLVRALVTIRTKKNQDASLLNAVGGDNMGKLFPVPGTTFMTRGR